MTDSVESVLQKAARQLRIKIHSLNGRGTHYNSPENEANSKWLDAKSKEDAEVLRSALEPMLAELRAINERLTYEIDALAGSNSCNFREKENLRELINHKDDALKFAVENLDLSHWGGPFDDEHPQGMYTCGFCEETWKPNGPGKQTHKANCVITRMEQALSPSPTPAQYENDWGDSTRGPCNKQRDSAHARKGVREDGV